MVTITPAIPEAEVVVNGQRIFDTAIVYSGSVIYFGKSFIFRYVNPQAEVVGLLTKHYCKYLLVNEAVVKIKR